MRDVRVFVKRNIIFVIFAVLAALFEMYALFFVGYRNVLIRAPWFSLAILFAIIALTAMIRSYAWRAGVLSFVLAAIISVDAGFIFLYEINGTAFDFFLLYQAVDGVAMIEHGQSVNYAYLLPSLIALGGFVTYAVFTANGLKGAKVPEKKPRLRAVCCTLAGVLFVGAVTCSNVLSYLSSTSADYYQNILYENDNPYKKYGVTGDVLYQLVTGPFATSPDVAEWEESSDFYFAEETADGELFGVSEGNNLIVLLAESFEWFPVTENPEVAAELYPNITRLIEESIVCANHYSREKTDVSESHSLLGNYPSRGFTCNTFIDNAYPYSLPNMYKNAVPDASVNSFHNNDADFYRRDEFHKSLGFDHLCGIEEMEEYGVNNYGETLRERNSDSEMMEAMKDEMFPESGSFFTYIISYTMHGGYYTERESLREKGYYDKLDEYGVYPETENKYDNYLRTYAAAYMDFDAALGIMFEDLREKDLLDSTTIVVFADHNAYFDDVSYHSKGLSGIQSEVFRVPMFIYDTKAKAALENAGKGKEIRKFTTTADIVPTVLTLLGIPYYSNLYFGNSVFSEEESIIFSRAYSMFITEDFVGYSLNSVLYRGGGFDRDDFIARAKKHLEKLKYTDALYLENFFLEHEFTYL